MMKRYSDIKLPTTERKAISAFSRRLKKLLGKQLVSVLLFGSKARGDYHKDSDTDIFILIKNKKNNANDKIAEATASVLDDYGILLSPVSYDLHEAELNIKMHSFFFEAVQKEGVPI
jgi:predicted nucleotidyltransferase